VASATISAVGDFDENNRKVEKQQNQHKQQINIFNINHKSPTVAQVEKHQMINGYVYLTDSQYL